MATFPTPQAERTTNVVVATSVMLTFISFWRAAAIVLNDLGSSAFYVGGIAEQAIGRAAPWFILGVMLFSYAVRAVYIESCAMFTRGGVYRVVKEALGGTLAKLSVSALLFDYILTGPISGVAAGQYIMGLLAQTLTTFGHPWHPAKETINLWAAGVAVLITGYFWRRNTRGLHASSGDALKIMYVTTVMVVLLIVWSGLTLLMHPEQRRLPPTPSAAASGLQSGCGRLAPGARSPDAPHRAGGDPAGHVSRARGGATGTALRHRPPGGHTPRAHGASNCLWPFGARDVRRRIPRAGQPRDRISEAYKPHAGWHGDFRVFAAVHLARLVPGLRAHS